MKKLIAIFMCLVMCLSFVGCNNTADNNLITKEEAYNIYYNTIKMFVPELMNENDWPECDINITTCDEVTFLTEHFVRNTSVKVQSQNVDGKGQYYLLNEFPEANKMNFYCIDNDKFYNISCALNSKGTLQEYNSSNIDSFLFTYLNTPLFPQEAISSFEAKKKDSDIEVTFIVKGDSTDYGYDYKVMREILPNIQEDKLDDIKIVLTIDKDGVAKTMFTEISMTILKDNGDIHAQKTLNMEYTFNKFDNVAFNLENIVSQYTADTMS